MPTRDRIPEGKRGLYVYISEDLYNKIHELGYSQYNKYHGAISAIVEEALRLYLRLKESQGGVGLSPGGSAHTHKTQKSVYNKMDKIKNTFREVLDMHRRLKNIPSSEIICEITRQDLSIAITLVRGSDRRTVENWINSFHIANLIMPEEGKKLEESRVFTVVDSACLDVSEYVNQDSNA